MKSKPILGNLSKLVLFVKDTLTMLLFLEMSNLQWLTSFNTSPVGLVIQPILATSMLAMSAIQIYQLYKEKNRSADSWINTVGGTLVSVLSNISIYGGILTVWAGASFAAGPWLFLAATGVGLIQQAILSGLNAHRAWHSPEHSAQKKHHQQAMIHHGIIALLCAISVVALTFVMLTPAAPLAGTIASLLVMGTVGALLIWRHLPHDYKLKIKDLFGMSKPRLDNESEEQDSAKLDRLSQSTLIQDPAALPERKTRGCLGFFNRETAQVRADNLEQKQVHNCYIL